MLCGMVTESSATGATTIEDLHPDMLADALRSLDGPALAAVSCVTTQLRSLVSHLDLWRDLCLATWPSLLHPRLIRLLSSYPDSHRSFFADAFPSPFRLAPFAASGGDDACLALELISAVDLSHRGVPILFRVVETDTSSPWFRSAPFRIDALDRKDPPSPPPPALPAAAAALADPAISPEDLSLSWIVTDPHRRRAVRVTSRRPVAIDRNRITGETVVKFGIVLSEEYALRVIVTCAEETGHVRAVSLAAEGVNRVNLSGREGLALLRAAMVGSRRMEAEEDDARRRWEEFVGRRKRQKEMAAQREQVVNWTCAAIGAAGIAAGVVWSFAAAVIG